MVVWSFFWDKKFLGKETRWQEPLENYKEVMSSTYVTSDIRFIYRVFLEHPDDSKSITLWKNYADPDGMVEASKEYAELLNLPYKLENNDDSL